MSLQRAVVSENICSCSFDIYICRSTEAVNLSTYGYFSVVVAAAVILCVKNEYMYSKVHIKNWTNDYGINYICDKHVDVMAYSTSENLTFMFTTTIYLVTSNNNKNNNNTLNLKKVISHSTLPIIFMNQNSTSYYWSVAVVVGVVICTIE